MPLKKSQNRMVKKSSKRIEVSAYQQPMFTFQNPNFKPSKRASKLQPKEKKKQSDRETKSEKRRFSQNRFRSKSKDIHDEVNKSLERVYQNLNLCQAKDEC